MRTAGPPVFAQSCVESVSRRFFWLGVIQFGAIKNAVADVHLNDFSLSCIDYRVGLNSVARAGYFAAGSSEAFFEASAAAGAVCPSPTEN